ncbi:hypothetical protein DSL72_004916 [Monilinia vaccinii-corymbosi]|uniref:RING-type domain-containing protein n=1 Tax=Monilinia vaccinii-corymbosi TaxID=61207 RepID=A0A8A3NXZ2_9HELO|nr:hypothetical protein DSL72_004916 [Monilinia vaccinii-corymbosi]
MSENIGQSSSSFSGQQNEQQYTQNEERQSYYMGEQLIPINGGFSRTQHTRYSPENNFTSRMTTVPRLRDDQSLFFSAPPQNEQGGFSSMGEESFSGTRALLDAQLSENDFRFGRTTISELGHHQTFSFATPQLQFEQGRSSSMGGGFAPRAGARILTQSAGNDTVSGTGTNIHPGDDHTFSFSAAGNFEDLPQDEEAQDPAVLHEPFQGNWLDPPIGRTRHRRHRSPATFISPEDMASELGALRAEVGFDGYPTHHSRPAAYAYGGGPVYTSRSTGNLTRTSESFHQNEDNIQDDDVFTTPNISSNATTGNARHNGERIRQADGVRNPSMPAQSFGRARGEPRRRVRFDREDNLIPAPHISSNAHRPSAEAFQQMMHPAIGSSQADFQPSPRSRPRRTFALQNEEHARTAELARSLIERERTRRFIAEVRARQDYYALSLSERRNQHRNDFRLEIIKGLLVPASAEHSDCCPICQEEFTAAVQVTAPVREIQSCPHCQKQYTTTPNNNDAHDACSMPVCSHVFGRGCITQWLKDKNTCPMCRAEIHLP